MKKRINLQLISIAILAVFATVIGTTIIFYGLFQKQVRADLRVSAKLLKDTNYFESVDIDREQIDLSTDISELRVTWVDWDGTVLYDNDANAEALENHQDRPEIAQAMEQGVGESVRTSDTMNKNTFYYAVVLDNHTILRVATDAQSLWAILLSSAWVTIAIVVGIIALCILISRMFTRQLIKPIETMAGRLEDAEYESPYKELEPFTQMIRSQHAQVLAAAKARQDFTANVSHELKTPLTAISGYAELMGDGMVEPSQQKHFCDEIRKNADRLLALINDILRLSDLDRADQEISFENQDLCETVKECMEEMSMHARQKDVKLLFEGEPCVVRGNKDLLKELCENLIQNAIRYNNPGGKVLVRVVCEEHPVLIVKDNGIGIPASEQARIFERFYRVDKSRSKATGGTGLGLAIVKHIVELHHASIELDSAPGVGTTVTVTF